MAAVWTKLGDSVQDLLASLFQALNPVYSALLTEATGTTTGTAVDVSRLAPATHTWTIQVVGSITAMRVDLEGALNDVGAQYAVIDTYEGTATTIRSVTGRPIRFVRAKVVSLTIDTGAPTVSAQYIGSH